MKLAVFIGILAFSILIAIRSRGGKRHDDIHDYFVAARQFGGILLFFLAVGESYTLGLITAFPGGVYLHGLAFSVWFVDYIVLAFPVGYFLGPLIWRAAQKYNPVTIADLYRGHFKSRTVEIIVAISAILFMIPWGEIQFAGLTMVLQGLGISLSTPWLMAAAAILALFYTMISGIRAPAYVSILKDTLLLASIAIVGIAVLHLPESHPVIAKAAASPDFTPREKWTMVSNILFQSLGFCMFPAFAASLFTARNPGTIRKAQIAMPLYLVLFAFLMVVAFYARGIPGSVSSPNQLFIDIAGKLLSPALIGLVAGGAALSGLVVLSGTCLVIGPLFTHNLLHNLSERQQKLGAQGIAVVYLICSMIGAMMASSIAATMNNLTYFGLTQFLPGVLAVGLDLTIPALAVGAGLLVGELIPVTLFFTHTDTGGINPGLIGLVCNFLILAAGAWAVRSSRAAVAVK